MKYQALTYKQLAARKLKLGILIGMILGAAALHFYHVYLHTIPF